jgi:hypothetical protein
LPTWLAPRVPPPEAAWLTAVRRRGGAGWSVAVRASPPPGAVLVPFDEAAATTGVNATVSRAVAGVGDPLWQLEVAKYAEQHLAVPLAAAFTLGDATVAGSAERLALRSPQPHVAARALRLILVEARSGTVLRAALRLLLAAPVALALFWATLLRYRDVGTPPRLGTDCLIALHGELTNRTRHLLPQHFAPEGEPAYAVIGRPRLPLRAVASLFDPENRYAGKAVFRPLSLGAALRSLPAAMSALAQGTRETVRTPVSLPLAAATAIAYRFIQGAAHAEWWQASGLRPSLVIFGHTGIADTTMLERAMQRQGTRTVHCVHGISHGWNFGGYSDLAIFTCGHDAALAHRFPGYRRTASIPLPAPEPAVGDGRWLLLTATAHPMNPLYHRYGIAPDIAALNMVAEAARLVGTPPDAVVWRPHPALAMLPAAHRRSLEARAQDLGFAEWPADWPYPALRRFGMVLTTPSTAALDALRLGKLPIILRTAALRGDTVIGRLPLQAADAATLAASIDRLAASDARHAAFSAAWDLVQPGEALAPADLRRLVGLHSAWKVDVSPARAARHSSLAVS